MSDSEPEEPAVEEMGEEEERRVNEEYMVWKKNSVFLYDIICTHALEWPSLTVQWLPMDTAAQGARDDVSVNRLIIGTHTSDGAANYLLRCDVHVPIDNGDEEDDSAVDVGGGAAAAGSGGGAVGADGDTGMAEALQKSWGGTQGKIETTQKVRMDGEVHRARYMPQRNNIVAVKSPSHSVYVFDLDGRPPLPAVDDNSCSPDGVLTGHTSEGWALSWSPHSAYEGHLVSGSDDHVVLRWDASRSTAGADLPALTRYEGHTDVVNDVAWHPLLEHVFGSVGDDHLVNLWDARESGVKASRTITGAHAADINCLAFNPFDEHFFATGASDGNIHLWDSRKLGDGPQAAQPMHVFAGHDKAVFQVQWNPQLKSVFGTCGADRRLYLWDMDKIGAEQSPEDAEDGPPEIVFVHGGHTSPISEFSWCPDKDDAWTLASVAEDNIMQVWMMAMELLEDGDYDDGAAGGGASSAARPPAAPVADDDLE